MYPSIEPYDSGHLDVGDGHAVYWEVAGSPDGLPAIWLHGGPGAPASPGSRRNFDPARYRAVIFDQRGCGRSRPLASDADADLPASTTGHLVADMERLRSHLGIDRWVVAGGSWGVTLALVYAQRHPERVPGMVLAAVTSGRWRETQAVGEEAARRWCEWEDTHMSLVPGYEPHLSVRELSWQMVFARLVTHYWGHGCFLADNEVLANMARIAHIPATLIHGLHDVSGPLDTAWELHKAWPASRLVVIDDAGHFGGSMGEQFTAAIDTMADQLHPA